jgi:alanyl-tRNA synthetase
MLKLIERQMEQFLGPWGILAVGLIAGMLAEPSIRRGVRRLAVLTTAGVLDVADGAKKVSGEAGNKLQAAARGVREELDKLAHEARETGQPLVVETEKHFDVEAAAHDTPEIDKGVAQASTEEMASIDATASRLKGPRKVTSRKKEALT